MSVRTLVCYDRLLEVLGAEGALLERSAAGGDPDAEVPGCPGLTLSETVRHLGSLYRMVLSWLREGDRPSSWQREPETGQPVGEYFLTGLRAVHAELSARDPGDDCPTWWPEHQSYGFWYRRLAHETTVHRIDVQGAAGLEVGGVADDAAADGVDEVLSLWFGHRLSVLGVSGTRHGRVIVRAGDHRWVARATPSGTSAWRAAAGEPSDATVRGEAGQVFRWLWGRLPPHRDVIREGSDDAVAQLWALLRLATR